MEAYFVENLPDEKTKMLHSKFQDHLAEWRKRFVRKSFDTRVIILFFYQGFLHRHWRFTEQQGKGGNHLLFHSTTSTRSRTMINLFGTLHVRWLSCIFNRNACVYQTATRWDLPPYWITIWVIDWWCNVCFFFTWWIDIRLLLQQFDIVNRWIWTHIDYTLALQAHWLTKCASHPDTKCASHPNYQLHWV